MDIIARGEGGGKGQKTKKPGKLKKRVFSPLRPYIYLTTPASPPPRPSGGVPSPAPPMGVAAPPFLRLRPHSLSPSPRFALCLGALTPAYPRGVPSCACVRDLDHAFPTVALCMRIYAYARLRAMGVAGFLSLLQFLSFPLYIIILGVWGPEARPPALRLVGPRMVVAAPRPAPIHGGLFCLGWRGALPPPLRGWLGGLPCKAGACAHAGTRARTYGHA